MALKAGAVTALDPQPSRAAVRAARSAPGPMARDAPHRAVAGDDVRSRDPRYNDWAERVAGDGAGVAWAPGQGAGSIATNSEAGGTGRSAPARGSVEVNSELWQRSRCEC
jgi:hypothetical protein